MNTFTNLHIGLVGCGNWGRYILRDLKELGVQTSVVARSETSRNNATAYGADYIVESIEELNENINGYIIASSASAHVANIRALLPRRKPIYVEKPLGIHFDDLNKLASESQGLVFVMHKWRYHPGIEALATLVQTEELGRVKGLRLQRTNWGRQHNDVDCALHLLPHDLSITLQILGYLPPMDTVIRNPLGDNHFGLFATLMDKDQNIYVTLDVNNIAPGNVRSIAVGFEKGVAALTDSFAEGITIFREYGVNHSPEVRQISQEMPLMRQIKAFLQYLSGGLPPLSNIQDELQILHRIHAIRNKLYGDQT
ncbi:Gfo/Idh/MocA family protein [Paenibacillus sp. YIM B09110]|uniref:Gfo/Idh/MocA family protein n=1 Tax=Paenibacillus sp. YIM B09110 TaxID=3126102 RepID=UPI00301E5151